MKLRENAMSKEHKKQKALDNALVRENPTKTKIVRDWKLFIGEMDPDLLR